MTSTTDDFEQIVAHVSSILSEMEEQTFRDERFSELSMRQMFYLNTILRLGHPTFGDLAHELNVSKPSVTSIVRILIQKGYVTRDRDDEDLRAYHIVVTPKALEFDQVHTGIHKQLAEQLTSRLSNDDKKILLKLLHKAFDFTE